MGTTRSHEVLKSILWLACAAALSSACDTKPENDILENHVSSGASGSAGTPGAAGSAGLAGTGGIGGAGGTSVAGTGGATGGTGGTGGGSGAAGGDEFAGAGGGSATDAGSIATDGGPATDDCPAGFECVTDPLFNALSACLPMGGGLPPGCMTDADCVKAGLPKGLCLSEEETGLNGCAQICTP